MQPQHPNGFGRMKQQVDTAGSEDAFRKTCDQGTQYPMVHVQREEDEQSDRMVNAARWRSIQGSRNIALTAVAAGEAWWRPSGTEYW